MKNDPTEDFLVVSDIVRVFFHLRCFFFCPKDFKSVPLLEKQLPQTSAALPENPAKAKPSRWKEAAEALRKLS